MQHSPQRESSPLGAEVEALIRGFEREAERCTFADARRLRRRLRGLRSRSGDAQAVAGWRRDLERAQAHHAARAALVPRPTYPELPIAARREEIVTALRRHQVIVVCGDTGSGKSTQLPKMCLEAGLGIRGAIGHTQPRRIAARSVAARLAEELGVALPGQGAGGAGRFAGPIGIKTRFDDRTGRETLVSVMTDGILLAETRHDRDLLAYEALIVDEAHERSLTIDFLLGYLARLLPRRPELKVIVTSATIDPERFAAHFAQGGVEAPIIRVEGRSYPIETRYRPLPSEAEHDEDDPDVLAAIVTAIEEIDAEPRAEGASVAEGGDRRRRDVLVFLSGEREIREAAEALGGRCRDSEVVPLYARLAADEQDRVFRRGTRRRIVLATNVAETSITVPGIEAVVDPGLARISRYSPRGRVQRLPVEAIAQASADQRRGRCGRVAPGLCIRLYSEEDLRARPRFTPPEILRTNLASVILQMASLSLGRPEEFPFIDPPSRRLIDAGYETLHELGAMTRRDVLTPIGRRMAHLPVDPRLARILFAAIEERCLPEALVIVAALSVQDPRERPADKAQAADFAQLEFRDERSDFLGFLRLWRAWAERTGAGPGGAASKLGASALRRWCRERFLSWMRMREWTDVHRQLREQVRELVDGQGTREEGVHRETTRAVADDPDPNAVHRALLAGLIANVGQKVEAKAGDREHRNAYRSTSGGEFFLHPSSVLARRTPPWVIAAEIVETSRRFARLCAKVQGDWLEKVAPHLCARVHSEPHWLRESGQVAAWERVSLGALTVVPRRRVPFGPIDPSGARDVFIQAALVEGDLRTNGTFLEHNGNLRAAIEMLEAKGRHANLLVESEARFAFYDARVPADVHSGPSFEKWRRAAEARDPTLLHMKPEDLMRVGAPTIDAGLFPDALVTHGVELPLSYRHAPGAEDDGVTVRVPLAAVAHIDPERLEWLVPGLIEEKIAALMRSLPKRLRVRFQPVAEFAQGAVESLPFGQGRLPEALARHLSQLTGVPVDANDFVVAGIDPHLVARVVIVDRGGKELASGRDAEAILRRFRLTATDEVRRAAAKDERVRRLLRRGLRDWSIDGLPAEVRYGADGLELIGYPCLADEGESAAVRIADTRDEALALHRCGVRRLLVCRHGSALGHHIEFLPQFESMALVLAPKGGGRALRRALAELAIDVATAAPMANPPTTPAEFDALAASIAPRLHASVVQAAALAEPIVQGRHETEMALAAPHPASWDPAVSRMRRDLEEVAPVDVLSSGDIERLRRVPRYLAAIRSRLRRLSGNVERDARLEADFDAMAAAVARVPSDTPHAERARLRFLLDEYRVHLFARELRTAIPVSAERLHAAVEAASLRSGPRVSPPVSKAGKASADG